MATDLPVTRPTAQSLSFAELGVLPSLVAVLAESGITSPFPIQAATLPDSLAGRDILGRGRTGSGKTVAFALPLVTALMAGDQRTRPGLPRGLVLVPTRELASQVEATLAPLADVSRLRTRVIFGGVGQAPQVAALKAGVDIIVATPGRLEDLIGQGHVSLAEVAVTVIDEADHMADLGFLPAVRRLLDATPKGQRLLFSATLDSAVDVLVRRYLVDPVTHSVDDAAFAVPDMEHHLFLVSENDRPEVVRGLLGGRGRALAFTRTKHQARKWAKQLTAAGIPAVDLHGNLSQGARERNLDAFSGGRVRVMVATDIAARGIHVDDINLVVHVDPPAEHKAYQHRSGRTARAGASGTVVTVATPAQRSDVAKMMRQAGITPTSQQVAPGSPAIGAMAGDPAPVSYPEPAPAATAPARSARPTSPQNPRPESAAQPAQGAVAASRRSRGRKQGTPVAKPGAAPVFSSPGREGGMPPAAGTRTSAGPRRATR
ncbi:MAG: DEAD/DEAH box helicase [Candidatus Nanopelagicales bacterium]